MPPDSEAFCTFRRLLRQIAGTEEDQHKEHPPAPLVWPKVLHLARHHRVLPLIASEVSRWPGVPEPIRQALAREAQEAQLRSLFLFHQLLNLLQAFQAQNIPVIPLKGPVLAWQVYGDPALRPSVDLDLLVLPENLEAAVGLLRAQGYRLAPEAARFWESPHRDYFLAQTHHLILQAPGRPSVELHLHLLDPRWRFRVRESDLFRRAETREVSGVRVSVLAPEDLLLYLLLHGGKHAWNRWLWLMDVHRGIQAFGGRLQWETLRHRARRWGGLRMAYLGLALAHRVLGTPVPSGVLREAFGDPGVQRFLPQLEIPGIPQAPGFWARIRYEAWMRSRGRFRWMAHFLWLVMERTLGPTQRDLFGRGPRPLPLAVLYRPLRILRNTWTQRCNRWRFQKWQPCGRTSAD